MKAMTLEAKLENLPQLTAWIDGQLEAMDCPMKAQAQIDVAIDEIFGNIARYAYPDGAGSATVQFDWDGAERAILITFIDQLGAADREIGGLGIFLVKKTMDDASYQFRDGMNVLTLKKRV